MPQVNRQCQPVLNGDSRDENTQLPAWERFFPAGDHRWTMGLRPGVAADFFATHAESGAICAERDRWLKEDAEAYAALLPEASPALRETLELARSLGTEIDQSLPEWEQLLALGRAWEVDFAWMHPDGEGVHRLIGGVVCFPSTWALRDKLGLPMSEVHGPIPGLNAALARNIEIFFARQEPGSVWTRENASYSRDAELNHHPSRPRRPLDVTITAEEVFIRLEHQLLLKLPISGSILFGIRTEILPLTTLMLNRTAAARLSQLFSSISPAAAEYKGIATARSKLISLLSSSCEVQEIRDAGHQP